jgi:hypothetical protein
MDASEQTPSTKQTRDTSTSTINTSYILTASQSSETATTDVGVQSPTIPSKTVKDADTTIENFPTTMESTQTVQTLTHPPSSSTITQANPDPCSTPISTSQSGKKKNHKNKKNSSTPPAQDAATTYDPPSINHPHCRLCHEPIYDQSTASSHLLTCHELPAHILKYRNSFFQQQSTKANLPIESLQTQTALFFTTHTLEDPELHLSNSTKDYLIGQLFLTALDDFERVETYHSPLSKFLRQMFSATLKYLKLHPSADLQHHLFYIQGLDPLFEDDEDSINHPFDLLDEFPDDESFYDEDYNEYDEEEF